MRKKNTLTKKQIDVIEEIFAGELEEQAIMEKYNVTARLYAKWQGEEAFLEQFERRIASAYRQSAAMIARNASKAATQLINLTKCDKGETARKACIDIITMQNSPTTPQAADKPKPEAIDSPQNLTPKTAAKILEILAVQRDEQQVQTDLP